MKIELQLPEDNEVSEAERKEYCAAIFAIFPRLEKDIKEKMYQQLVLGFTDFSGALDFAAAAKQAIRYEGIMEGMAILLEHWRLASNEFEVIGKEENI